MTESLRKTPYWWVAAPLEAPRNEPVPGETDVVVVGGGYTGLAAALTLARAGKSVQLFDRQRLGEGASTRNGGVVSGNLRYSLSEAVARYGKQRGEALYREGKEAREDLRRFVEAEGNECDFRHSGRFAGAHLPSQ